MIKKIPFVVIAMALGCQLAYAQTKPQGAAVVASEPGKAMAAETIKASVGVTAIDKATRTISMKSSSGETFDVVAGDDVRNFDQIKVGDQVVVQYVRALSLELKKSTAASTGPTVTTDAVRAKQGEKPGGAVGRQVTAMTTVTDVNPKNQTISLKGPRGNTVVLDVRNPDHFKVVKKGDKVEVVYTEALALSVEPAAKKK
jgi:membrane-bound ClpP family serine protease